MAKHNKLLGVWIISAFLIFLLAACGGSQGSGESTSSSQTGGQSSGGSSLVGTWSGNCAVLNIANTIEFRDGGTIVANNVVGTYAVNGNQIQLSAGGYTVEYSFELSQSGNILKLSDMHNAFCALGREGSDAVGEIRQALIGSWTISGQTCQSVLVYHLNGLSQLDFKTDQTVDVTTSEGSETDVYILQDASTIVFRDNLGNTEPYIAWISGNTLTLEDNPGPGLGGIQCSFQKSA